ncbi:hypothetical protein DNL40_05105 [Xylanimonas oleitrophica]|uniref:GmrSD restriction endonucleases N-terminal domain-containing protein n=1 Tax=Xylanimonas oleitrophica TaxID=2607479 RepID=A0A2W5WSF4_9MICO|nr:hypothetical protein DNL40_05105 [Xylanimonas oleitrophica]
MSDPLTIERLIGRVRLGELRIPGFQREFVWEPRQAALLMDSIYKGFPFGSILLWRTGNKLKTERKLGGFMLPDPAKDYPIDYVLDGQQRVTSILRHFRTISLVRKKIPRFGCRSTTTSKQNQTRRSPGFSRCGPTRSRRTVTSQSRPSSTPWDSRALRRSCLRSAMKKSSPFSRSSCPR